MEASSAVILASSFEFSQNGNIYFSVNSVIMLY